MFSQLVLRADFVVFSIFTYTYSFGRWKAMNVLAPNLADAILISTQNFTRAQHPNYPFIKQFIHISDYMYL
jgi:Ni,Fe-hydrogenase III small subunit